MANVLISFRYDVKDNCGYEKALVDFENNDYIVYDYNVSGQEFSIETLYYAVQDIKDKHRGSLDRIAVISNIRYAIFIWYRCYNYLVNDYIYFIDESGLDIIGGRSNLIKNLSDLSGIGSETIVGKIYIHLTFSNHTLMLKTLIQNYNFKYFSSLDMYDFKHFKDKDINKKIYSLENDFFTFEPDIDINSPDNEIVDLSVSESTIDISENFFKELISYNTLFFCIICCGLYEHTSKDVLQIITDSLNGIRKSIDFEKDNKIIESITNFIHNNKIKISDKVFLFYMISVLKGTPWEF
ncbi:MAG: hypothetical protein N3I35_07475 [Clostridia bacterium]|nr:hypothetical protein [Clostridia bacterium]